MKRISTSTAVQNKFVDGNKDTGLKPTKLNAEWFNQVQEEICKLLEAAGITVGGSDNQLTQLFTTLFVLEAAFKSIALKKFFSGGYSQTNINGENLKMLAEGTSVTDNSSVELSRLLMKFMKSSASGALITEISPAHFSVKASGSSDAVELEILNDRILFKSGDPLAQHASIVYDPTTGNLTITGIGGITLGDKLYAVFGLVGDLETDFITPATTDTPTPVTIGSVAGGVQLVGRTIGFKGKVSTNEIEAEDANYPVWVKAILKATNVPNDFVSVDSITNNDPASSRTLLVESAWTVGQVKRFLNTQSSDKVIWIYVDTSGGNRSITIPAHCFVTVACTGIYTNTYLDNEKFAVLAVEACNA